MDLLIAAIALAVACWQLKLQRDVVQENSQITSLIHVSRLLERKIEYHERIIENMKERREDWSGHAMHVNKELRPLLTQVHARLLSCVERKLPGVDPGKLKQVLRLSNGEDMAGHPQQPTS